MFSKRRQFCSLSSRQKKRRINEMFTRNEYSDGVQLCSSEDTETNDSTNFMLELSEVESKMSEEDSDIENPCTISNDSHVSECTEGCLSDHSFKCENNCLSKISNTISETLGEWLSTEKKVPHKSVDRLLSALREKHFVVPASSKTLLNQKQLNIHGMGHGEYLHCDDWVMNLKEFVLSSSFSGSEINLCVNVDGLSLFNPIGMSKYSVYPILVKTFELPNKIFCVGIYSADKHEFQGMPHPNTLLVKFFEDISTLSAEGIVMGDVNVKVSLSAFICDAPVRSSLKNIVSHCGYSSCERCTVKGDYHGNTVVFLVQNSVLRNDNSFAERSDVAHHKTKNKNIIERNNFGMVSGFVLDVMHLCYLGVVKRILIRLFSIKVKEKSAKLSSREQSMFNDQLFKYKNYIPVEFSRKLEGGVKCILKWKATQYRLFGLYVGIVLFRCRKIVSYKFYTNFLKLSIALRLLNTKGQEENIGFIRNLLHTFIEEAKVIYKKSFISYNVHNLMHIPDDYLNYGVLDDISAFDFENYLVCEVKNSVRAGFKPLVQIGKHVTRKNSVIPEKHASLSSVLNSKCDHDESGNECLKVLRENGMVLKPSIKKCADSFVMMKNGDVGEIISIHIVENNIVLDLKKYTKTNFFKNPIPSGDVGIFKLHTTSTTIKVNFYNILLKLLVLPYKICYIGIPILHSIQEIV